MSDFDLAIIGSGPGGYVSAIRAAQLGLKTVIIEKDLWGGVCLNVGCIPSKCLLEDSLLFYEITRADERGFTVKDIDLRWDGIQKRKEKVVKQLTDGVAFLLKKNRVEMMNGIAKFIDAKKLEVSVPGQNPEVVTAKHFLIATGSRPAELPHIKIDHNFVIDSTDALALSEPPESLLVIGAGAIGLELGSVYARVGTDVTVVEIMPQCLPGIDKEVADTLRRELERQKIKIYLDSKVDELSFTNKRVTAKVSGKFTGELTVDKILLSVGRVPNTEGLKLENAGVAVNEKGFILVNEKFQTSVKNIYAIGDVIGGKLLAHKASHEGKCAVEIIAGEKPFTKLPIPAVIYTQPEVATVGLSEEEARRDGIAIKVGKFPFRANGRALSALSPEGFAKVIADEETEQILGVHIIGIYAGELISEAVFAMTMRATLDEYQLPIRAHPTFSEVLQEAALSADHKAIHKVD